MLFLRCLDLQKFETSEKVCAIFDDWATKNQTCFYLCIRVFSSGWPTKIIEEITRIQLRIGKETISLSTKTVSSAPGNDIYLRTEVASQFTIPKQGGNS